MGDINQISSLLTPLIGDASDIYTDHAFDSKHKSIFSRFLHGRSPKAEGLAKLLESSSVLPLEDLINDIRNIKSDAEIANMRKAGQASGRAFTDAMRQGWIRERDLAAHLEYKFRVNDCDGSAYVPVVAGGQVNVPRPWLLGSIDSFRTLASFITPKTIISSGMLRGQA